MGGTRYISSKRASEMSDYSQDYIGQLARSGAIDAKRLSGLWYVSFDSLQAHKAKAESYVPQPPHKKSNPQTHKPADTSISFDGRSYISSARAAKITGYNPDYVTQLAREGKILSKQVGNRWFIDQEGVVAHKKEKDALLASVQVESVGLQKASVHIPAEKKSEGESLSPITYFKEEERDLMPRLEKSSQNIDNPMFHNVDSEVREVPSVVEEGSEEVAVVEQSIPIRIVQRPVEIRQRTYSAPALNRRVTPKGQNGLAWASLAGVVTVAVVLVAYVGVAPGYSNFTLDNDAQYANAVVVFERVGAFLENLLIDEVSFSRK